MTDTSKHLNTIKQAFSFGAYLKSQATILDNRITELHKDIDKLFEENLQYARDLDELSAFVAALIVDSGWGPESPETLRTYLIDNYGVSVDIKDREEELEAFMRRVEIIITKRFKEADNGSRIDASSEGGTGETL